MTDDNVQKLKDRLHVSENTLVAILNLIPDTVFKISKNGDFLDCKAGADQDLLAPILEIIGSNVSDIFSEELADQYLYYINKALETKHLQVCEYKQVINHVLLDFEARFIASSEENVRVLVRNITKRKVAEDKLTQMIVQLQESQDNLVSILNQMSQGSAITDHKGRLTFLSYSAIKLLQINEEDCLGQNWQDVISLSHDELEHVNQMLELAPKARGKTLIHIVSKQGQQWIDLEIKDHPHEPKKKILFFHDVTEVHRLRQLLRDKTPHKGIVGNSQSMQRVYQQISELAPADLAVLIQGETGTGKEVVAHAIHNASPRKAKPFIAVNCAGLVTDSLLGSQLFGHKKGSFTGAIEDHKGFLEVADGGTLFLDEIGDMPISVQTQLLRFLQEKEIMRIGENITRKLNVRIIAASQHDLDDEVKKGKFRLDLLYRIRVATIYLPPLRERREDIPLLTAWFIKKHAKEQGKEIQHVSNDAMQILVTHYWNGNVRELEGVISISVLRCQGAIINTADLPLKEMTAQSKDYEFNPENKLSPAQRIVRVIEETHGNKTKAAKLLGMSRSTLYRKIKAFNIPIESQPTM